MKSKLFPLILLAASPLAHGALTLSLNGGGGAPTSGSALSSPSGKTQAGSFSIDLGTLSTSINLDVGPGTSLGAPSATGSLAGLSGTLTFNFIALGTNAQKFNPVDFTGGTSYLTTGITAITTGTGTWAVGSDINENVNNLPGQGVVFTLDLSGVVGDTSNLMVSAVRLYNDNSSDGARISYLANGASSSTAVYAGGGAIGSNVINTVSQGLADGDALAFWTAAGTSGQRRLYGFTFDVVPEPSTTLLGALGMLALLRRRR